MTHAYIIGSKYPFYLKKIKNRTRNLLSNKENFIESSYYIGTDRIIFYFSDRYEKETKIDKNYFYIENANDFYMNTGLIYELLTKTYQIKKYYYVYNESILKYGYGQIFEEFYDILDYEFYKDLGKFYISENKEDCISYISDFLDKEISKTKDYLNFLESLTIKNN